MSDVILALLAILAGLAGAILVVLFLGTLVAAFFAPVIGLILWLVSLLF